MTKIYETSTDEFLQSVLREIATRASMGAAYKTWADEFVRQEVEEAWADIESPLRRSRNRTVTVLELKAIPVTTLRALGFGNWNSNLTLIPLWAYHYIAEGETLVSISGDTAVTGTDEIDLDVRGGCVAYGFTSQNIGPEK